MSVIQLCQPEICTTWDGSVAKPLWDGLGTNVTWHCAGPDAYQYSNDALVERVCQTGRIAVLNYEPSGYWDWPGYPSDEPPPPEANAQPITFEELVAKYRAIRPTLPLLNYCTPFVNYDPPWGIGNWWIYGISEHPEWVYRTSNHPNGITTLRYPNMAIKACRDWYAERLIEGVKSVGTDGMFTDFSHRRPNWVREEDKDAYAAGWDDFMMMLKCGLCRIYPNAIWSENQQVTFEEQITACSQRFIASGNGGGMLEMYGMDPWTQREADPDTGQIEPPKWDVDVEPYWRLNEEQQQCHWLFYGRYTWADTADTWVWPFEDWGRYMYATYLMCATPFSSFNYCSTFQIPTTVIVTDPEVPEYGSGGDYCLPDAYVAIGPAEGVRVEDDPIYSRKFSNAWACCHRHDGYITNDLGEEEWYVRTEPIDVTIPDGAWYDIYGVAYSGTYSLAPGYGLVLFDEDPTA